MASTKKVLQKVRPAKFRAWDMDKKRMFEVAQITFGFNVDRFGQSVMDYDGNLYPFGEIKLMQFTGLKDKNGKEVYEGDILGNLQQVENVEWNESRSGWNVEWINVARWKVIGNIYEKGGGERK